MAFTRKQKEEFIQDLEEKVKRQKSMVFVNFAGLKVDDITDLRKKMKKENCELKVAKKTLLSLVFRRNNIDVDPRKDFKGEIALGFSYEDPIAPFRIIYRFSKENENLKILGGFIDKIISSEEAIEIGQLPDRDSIIVKLLGSLKSPVARFVSVLEGNIKGLIFCLKAIKK